MALEITQPHVYTPPGPNGARLRRRDSASSAETLNEISRAAEELRQRLEDVLAQAHTPAVTSDDETELGQLFVKSQHFIDHSVADARREASTILDEARAGAARILEEARRQADELLEDARRQSSIPTEALEQLGKTIDSFSRANGDLAHELKQLQSALQSQGPDDPRSIEQATADPPASSTQYWSVPDSSPTEPSSKGWNYRAG